jgi:hypothetical protein
MATYYQPFNEVADPDLGGQNDPQKIEKNEKMSWSELLDILFREMKAYPEAWTSSIEAYVDE